MRTLACSIQGAANETKRKLGRLQPAMVTQATVSCNTCGRIHLPGFRTCCSPCTLTAGRQHSARCDLLIAGAMGGHRRGSSPSSMTHAAGRGTDEDAPTAPLAIESVGFGGDTRSPAASMPCSSSVGSMAPMQVGPSPSTTTMNEGKEDEAIRRTLIDPSTATAEQRQAFSLSEMD